MAGQDLVEVSFRWACGCLHRRGRDEPIPAGEAVHPGLVRDCPKHGEQKIVRVTTWLVEEGE